MDFPIYFADALVRVPFQLFGVVGSGITLLSRCRIGW